MIKFCPNCGKEVSSKFCPYCGCEVGKFIIESNTEPVNPKPPVTPVQEIPVISTEPEDPAEDMTDGGTPAAEIPAEPAAPVEETPVFSMGNDTFEENPFSFEPESEPAPEIKADPAPQFNTYSEPSQHAGNTHNTQYAQYQQTHSGSADYTTYYIPPETNKESVTHKTWFIILFLILFWPLGLFFMWRAKKFSKAARVIITVIISLLFVLSLVGAIASAAWMVNSGAYDEIMEMEEDHLYEDDYDYDYDSGISSDSDALVDGRTATEAAESYLNALNFSREGLIEQLEYEGYSNSDATAAVESLAINWNEQAAGSARNYLDVFPDMSRSEMIEQLEYEGYTHSQAVYGADAAGL